MSRKQIAIPQLIMSTHDARRLISEAYESGRRDGQREYKELKMPVQRLVYQILSKIQAAQVLSLVDSSLPLLTALVRGWNREIGGDWTEILTITDPYPDYQLFMEMRFGAMVRHAAIAIGRAAAGDIEGVRMLQAMYLPEMAAFISEIEAAGIVSASDGLKTLHRYMLVNMAIAKHVGISTGQLLIAIKEDFETIPESERIGVSKEFLRVAENHRDDMRKFEQWANNLWSRKRKYLVENPEYYYIQKVKLLQSNFDNP